MKVVAVVVMPWFELLEGLDSWISFHFTINLTLCVIESRTSQTPILDRNLLARTVLMTSNHPPPPLLRRGIPVRSLLLLPVVTGSSIRTGFK